MAEESRLIVTYRKPLWLRYPPVIQIDGTETIARFGQNSYPIRPGRHRISCAARGLSGLNTFGLQTMEVDVPPGRSVEVHYSAPVDGLLFRGRMGLTEQTRSGSAILITLLALLAVAGLLAVVLPLIF